MISTPYSQVTQAIFNKAAKIKLLVCDVDGVFSDGRIYLGNNGEELKAFHTKDGFGIKALAANGIDVAVITGRTSAIVEQRMKALNVKYIVQGAEDKLPELQRIVTTMKITPEQVAYIGDDVPDLACMNSVGLGVAVADAHPLVLQQADWQTHITGGFGAVRELCDLILQAQNKLELAKGASV